MSPAFSIRLPSRTSRPVGVSTSASPASTCSDPMVSSESRVTSDAPASPPSIATSNESLAVFWGTVAPLQRAGSAQLPVPPSQVLVTDVARAGSAGHDSNTQSNTQSNIESTG